MIACPIPLLGFCAWGSNLGKTTLLTRLIPVLIEQGLRISVIKHAHHSFDIDHPGKDSYRIRASGAVQTLLGSSQRWALMTELAHASPECTEASLGELVRQMDTALADLILVEGFRQEAIAKIEVYRPSLGHPLLASSDPHIIAVASDGPAATGLPVLDLNDPHAIAKFVSQWMENLAKSPS